MKIDLRLPPSLHGYSRFNDALNHTNGTPEARSIIETLIEIITQKVGVSVQQSLLSEPLSEVESFPVQDGDAIKLVVEIGEDRIDAGRGGFFDLAFDGSEQIRRHGSRTDIEAAAVFEVICDILEEGIPLAEQQDLLDANLSEEG
jgi:hypothetical protein